MWVLISIASATTACSTMNNTPHHKLMDDGEMEEENFISVLAGPSFLHNCLKYLPNPFNQAKRDIPRMHVSINNDLKVNDITHLMQLVAYHQAGAICALCTQVTFGACYAQAVEMVRDASNDVYVCEMSPNTPARIHLISSSPAAPYTISSVNALKTMRAVNIVHNNCPRWFEFSIDVDTGAWSKSILCVTQLKKTPVFPLAEHIERQ